MALVKSRIGVIWMSVLMAGSIAHAMGITLEHDPGGSVVGNQKKGFPFALKINAPWKNSGHVLLNLPEHLDHRDGNAQSKPGGLMRSDGWLPDSHCLGLRKLSRDVRVCC